MRKTSTKKKMLIAGIFAALFGGAFAACKLFR